MKLQKDTYVHNSIRPEHGWIYIVGINTKSTNYRSTIELLNTTHRHRRHISQCATPWTIPFPCRTWRQRTALSHAQLTRPLPHPLPHPHTSRPHATSSNSKPLLQLDVPGEFLLHTTGTYNTAAAVIYHRKSWLQLTHVCISLAARLQLAHPFHYHMMLTCGDTLNI